jgi:hypothetical protein
MILNIKNTYFHNNNANLVNNADSNNHWNNATSDNTANNEAIKHKRS